MGWGWGMDLGFSCVQENDLWFWFVLNLGFFGLEGYHWVVFWGNMAFSKNFSSGYYRYRGLILLTTR